MGRVWGWEWDAWEQEGWSRRGRWRTDTRTHKPLFYALLLPALSAMPRQREKRRDRCLDGELKTPYLDSFFKVSRNSRRDVIPSFFRSEGRGKGRALFFFSFFFFASLLSSRFHIYHTTTTISTNPTPTLHSHTHSISHKLPCRPQNTLAIV